MGQPEPDSVWGACDDCAKWTRLFEYDPDYTICLPCYRDLIDAVIETVFEEGDDAAS